MSLVGLRVGGDTEKWGLKKIEMDWDADYWTSSGKIPVEPKLISGVVRKVIDPAHTEPVVVDGTVVPKGAGLWMPNTGVDKNYVNVRAYMLEVIHMAGDGPTTTPPVADLRRAQSIRVMPTVGPGGSRHKVDAVGFGPFTFTERLKPGEALTVFFGLSAEIDQSNDSTSHGLPLLRHWHGGQITWTAYTTGDA